MKSINQIIVGLESVAEHAEVMSETPGCSAMAGTYREEASRLREAIALLRTHPDAQPNEPQGGGWISTEDKPQDGEAVLVYTAWHETMTTMKAVCINGAWWRSPGMCRLPSIPTHWRPLPEPPKEEK